VRPPPLPVETMEQTSVDEQGLDAPQDTGKQTDKYSFFDSPGASDSLIAFGASMLKAPDFLTGLADGAMAVNQVAQKYRPYSQVEMEKVKQLAQAKLISDPEYYQQATPEYTSAKAFEGTDPNTGERVLLQGFLDKAGGYIYQMPDGSMTNSPPVVDLVPSTDSFSTAMTRADAQVERQAITDAYTSAQSAASNIRTYDNLLSILPEAGVGTALDDRAWALYSKLTGVKTTGNDPKNIALFESQMSQIALNTSRSLLQGQGQVTESERARIDVLVGGRDKLTIEAAKELFAIAKRAEERKVKLFADWKGNPRLRQQFNNRFTEYHAAKMAEANTLSVIPNTGGADQNSGTSNTSGNSNELEDALSKYGN
jgi:hypothetical protein